MCAARRAPGSGALDAVVIGAGHSGLAASHCLAEKGVEHVVLERGEVANSWRHERWDSLRLLTPNWQSSLPGFEYRGTDPDGFMDMPELIGFIEAYADRIEAPLHTGTEVTALRANGSGYQLQTAAGERLSTRTVVIASGGFNRPSVPAFSAQVPGRVTQFTAHDYRNPGQLPDGEVLVVGASATGVQLADEIHRAGHPVTLAVGEHVRLPRRYRGRDIQYWMHKAGVLDMSYTEVDDLNRARHVASPQLVGTPDHATLDLNALSERGVALVGKVMGVRDGHALISGGLRNVCALSDLKMRRLLREIDAWIEDQGLGGDVPKPESFEDTRIPDPPTLKLDLANGAINTIVWATGFKPDYSWLDLPVLDRKGMIRHEGGVVADAPGVYLLGLPFLRKRKSSFIHGAEDDARYVVDQLVNHLGAPGCAVSGKGID